MENFTEENQKWLEQKQPKQKEKLKMNLKLKVKESSKKKSPQIIQFLEEHQPGKLRSLAIMVFGSRLLIKYRRSQPQTVKEVLNCSEKKQWEAAMQKEMDSIHYNDVWGVTCKQKYLCTYCGKQMGIQEEN